MRRLIAPLVTGTALFLAIGCIAPEMPPTDDEDGETAPVATRNLEQGQHSGHTEKRHEVIEDAQSWEAFWQTHSRDQIPQPEAPEMDFNTERVVIAVQGERPNGCYHVMITDVQLVDGQTRVEVTEYVPTEDMVCTDVIVQPHHFIAVPADSSPVAFEEHEVEGFPEQ